MAKLFVRVFLITALFLPWRAWATEADWRVAKATAQVLYTVDSINWLSVETGMAIPNGAWISTGPRGRVVLRRNVESITFHPQTLASITTTYAATRQTQVVQQQGTLDLEIEKRSKPHTIVDTPYLAAVVKGTIFRVAISKHSAAVSVSRGLVGVKSFTSGQQADLGPGQSARVDAKRGMSTAGVKSRPAIASTPTTVSPVRASLISGPVKLSLAGTTHSVSGFTAGGGGPRGGSKGGSSNAGGHGHGSSGVGNSPGNTGNGHGNGSGSGNSNGNGNGKGDNSGGGGSNGNSGNGNGSGGHGGGNGSSGNGNGHGNGNNGKSK